MTDLEKIELAIRRLAERLSKTTRHIDTAWVLKQLADQIAIDQAERRPTDVVDGMGTAEMIRRRDDARLVTLMRQARAAANLKYKHGKKAVSLAWPSGEPVRSGEIEPGSIVEYEIATGIIKEEH